MDLLIPREETSFQRMEMLNGNEAVAWAALAAGVDYFSHYPGSPVNLIEPTLKKLDRLYQSEICFNDALNEHIATLAAAGASYCGARSLLVMKHVGLNIAADPLNYLGYTGVKGGMVIVVGTDPGANSSTGEEDVHWYVPQTNFPLFEPTNIQEIYDYTIKGFELSEKYEVPVFLFLPVRVCQNTDRIPLPKKISHKKRDFYFQKDEEKYINVGQKAVRNHKKLLERIEQFAHEVSLSKSFFNATSEIGLITRGVTFGHTFEAVHRLELTEEVHLLNLDQVYPLNQKSLLQFLEGKKQLIFIEDQDGFLENQVKMNLYNELCERGISIEGKEFFPKYGEIEFSQVMQFLAKRFELSFEETPPLLLQVPERLGTFCEGCPHRASFYTIDRVLEGTEGIIGGDIGCSSLPPHRADWLLCMNSGVGVAQGMNHILKDQPVISTGGEGSFFHAGFLSIQSAVQNGIDLLHLVFDNRFVAMTGHQESPTTHHRVDYKKLLESIHVDSFVEVNAFDPNGFQKVLDEEMKKTGVRVIWVLGDCALRPDSETIHRRKTKFLNIQNEKCGDCQLCYKELGCPAINALETQTTPGRPDLTVDLDRCMRCGVCIEICPEEAIDYWFEPLEGEDETTQ